MASKENIRKELGAEDRELTPDYSRQKQASVGQADIWMTPELKEVAKALQKSWSFSHDEQMASLNIRDINLKFASHEKRASFLKSLEHLAKFVNPNFPSTFPLPKWPRVKRWRGSARQRSIQNG